MASTGTVFLREIFLRDFVQERISLDCLAVLPPSLPMQKISLEQAERLANRGEKNRVMAQAINESIKRQLAKPQVWFCKYFPVRIRNVGEDAIKAHNLVWAFKDAKEEATERVARMTSGYLVCQYGDKVKDMTFICVPASSEEKNVSRYKHFCQRVSELCGIANGFSFVHVSGERPALHEHRHGKTPVMVDTMTFDAGLINGKTICVFDDVISTGQSYGMFADRLERLGAKVVGGVFLSRTHYRYKKEN